MIRLEKYSFPVLSISVTATPERDLEFPSFSGSTLRGALGWSLKDAVCVVEHRRCEDCFLTQNCLFPQAFDTHVLPEDREHYASYSDPPKGFVITPAGESLVPAREEFSFSLTVFGSLAENGEYWVHALQKMGERGLTGDRVPFQLQTLAVLDQGVVYEEEELLERPRSVALDGGKSSYPDQFSIEFRTPTRLSGRNGMSDTPDPETLVRNVMRRLAVLSYFHNQTYWEDFPFQDMLNEARNWELVKDETRWVDWSRYSQRRDESMKLGGIVGEAVYEGPVSDLGPLLEWGQWTHIGKNTSFGLGAYKISWM